MANRRPAKRRFPVFLLAAALIAAASAPGGLLRPARSQAATAVAGPALDAAVLAEINAARTDPKAYAQKLRAGPRSPAASDAIAFLEQQQPLAALTFDERLAGAAKAHAADQAVQSQPGHTGTDGSRPIQRMQAAGAQSSIFAEVISLGQDRAADVVSQLIIDAPGPRHPHRDDLFDPLLKFAAVGCGPSKAWRALCVVDLTGASLSGGGEELASSDRPVDQSAAQTITPLPLTADRGGGPALPPADETRFEADTVVIEVAATASPQAIAALEQRHRLAPVDRFASQLTGDVLILARITDRAPPAEVVRALGGEPAVISAQPDYLFTLQAGDKAPQYALEKLRLPQAHQLAKGAHVLVGMIDSGVDTAHPEVRGAVAATFDAQGGANGPQAHGTAIAGLICAHARLTGSAPQARILAARAFDVGPAARGSSFAILKSLDWLAAHGARVVNMSFAGPPDPDLHRALESAWRNGVTLVAAAGNGGPNSAPLYPAAEPHVIAVAASDVQDRVYAASNRGPYIALAAPGVDVLVASPGGGYQVLSGTSFAAAEVSGVVALMIERKPGAKPDEIRATLLATGRPLGPSPGLRLVDAYRAILGSSGQH